MSIDWYGNEAGGAENTSYVSPGLYLAELSYDGRVASIPLAVVPASSDYRPLLWKLEARTGDGSTTGSQLQLCTPGTTQCAGSGSKFLVTADHPLLRVYGELGTALRPFLDGVGPNPPAMGTAPYEDAFWTVEFKSSQAPPLQAEVTEASDPNQTYRNLTQRESWHLIQWGNAWPAQGQIVADLDTSSLPEGYYDVRVWVTDGQGMAHAVVFYVKVSRTGDTPSPGGASDVGALTLSATDMELPVRADEGSMDINKQPGLDLKAGPAGFIAIKPRFILRLLHRISSFRSRSFRGRFPATRCGPHWC